MLIGMIHFQAVETVKQIALSGPLFVRVLLLRRESCRISSLYPCINAFPGSFTSRRTSRKAARASSRGVSSLSAMLHRVASQSTLHSIQSLWFSMVRGSCRSFVMRQNSTYDA